jgi:hypothetical protein
MSPMLRERPLRQESAAACGCKALPRAIKLGRMEDIPQDARFPARHWHALADGRLQCDVCPRDTPATPAATLTRARATARGHGLRYVYTGAIEVRPGVWGNRRQPVAFRAAAGA